MQANDMAGTPATDVCNIYVFSSVGSGIAGFSWVNNNTSNITWDGVYMKADWLNSSVITHELGHYCGLYHTFNNSQCGQTEADCQAQGDFVCDTPPTSANLNCESPYCSSADYTNHMDYTQHYCRDHFTSGQVERMHMMLVNGGRSSVWQSGLCSDPDLLDVGVLSINNTKQVRRGLYANGAAEQLHEHRRGRGKPLRIYERSAVGYFGGHPPPKPSRQSQARPWKANFLETMQARLLSSL